RRMPRSLPAAPGRGRGAAAHQNSRPEVAVFGTPMKQLGTIKIARQFRGPPNSGNGGYSCGRLAAFIDGPAEVTLRKPPPLDTEMQVAEEADGAVALYSDGALVASAVQSV